MPSRAISRIKGRSSGAMADAVRRLREEKKSHEARKHGAKKALKAAVDASRKSPRVEDKSWVEKLGAAVNKELSARKKARSNRKRLIKLGSSPGLLKAKEEKLRRQRRKLEQKR